MSATVDATKIPSANEQHEPIKALRRGTTRWLAIGVVLLAVCLIGAAALSDAAANLEDFAKVVGVVVFVISMIALALGVVGSASRS